MMRNPLPEEEVEIDGYPCPADPEGLVKQHTRHLNEYYAQELKRIRHERKSIEKLYRTIAYCCNEEKADYKFKLGHILVAFYRDQPTKLYDVILQILGPEQWGWPGKDGWKKEVNFEAFLQYKSEMEKG
jgi:hypothetical protein